MREYKDLKDLLQQFAKIQRLPIKKKEFRKLFCNFIENTPYTEAYVKMYIEKCIVNNEGRAKWGQGLDLFYEKDGLLYYYKKEMLEIEYVFYDKALKKQKEKIDEKETDLELKKFLEENKDFSISYPKTQNKILVVASCTKSKVKTEEPIPAKDFYRGDSIRSFKRLIQLRQDIDYYFLSTKYGFIPCDYLVKYYNMTLRYRSKSAIQEFGKILQLRKKFELLLNQNGYDYALVILTNPYLQTLNLLKPFNLKINTKIVFFQLESSKDKATGKNVFGINLNAEDIKNFYSITFDLKGKILLNYFENNKIFNIESLKTFIKNGYKQANSYADEFYENGK